MIRFYFLASALALAACASVKHQPSGSTGQPETRTLTRAIDPIREPMLARLSSIRVKNLATGAEERL